MKFEILYPYVDSSKVEIGQNEYEKILMQKKIALNALKFEESMHAILGNYIDYLKTISEIVQNVKLIGGNGNVHKKTSEINRRINNFFFCNIWIY